MVTENSSPKPTLPLLKVKGFTHGWPRFEASFGGDDVNIEAMNVYLGLYGYEVVPKVRYRPKNHVTVAKYGGNGCEVADFICDGDRDDIEIQCAIDSISPGGTIFIHHGEYTLKYPLQRLEGKQLLLFGNLRLEDGSWALGAEMPQTTPATAKPKIRPVNDVYDQYRHMDELLSDEELLKGSLKGKMLHDFWQAIKLAIGLEAQP